MNSFFDTLKQLGPARLAIMGGVVAGLLLFFVFVSMRMSSPNMKMLYSDLASNDSSAMAGKLEEAKIPYEVSPDGTKISVPSDDVGRARMLLAADGLPNGGSMGYEIFDKQSGFGTTNFVQNINQVRALEGELSRTIGSLQQIHAARVHLVLPQRELFSRDTQPASASVLITMKSGARLEKEQILAIQSLVSSAVPQLKSDKVAIVDSAGNLLARGNGDDADNLGSGKDNEVRREYETRTGQTIEDIIGRVVGYGKVRANVTVDMNFDRVTTNSESYNPDQQVARSVQSVTDKSNERQPASGGVSVQNNLPGIAGDQLNQPTSEANRTEETTNYEISKTITNMVHEGGDVKRQSVAVLVDGDYTDAPDPADATKTVKTYKPRSDAEIKQIEALVKTAIGFDEKRGDTVSVVNMQFADVTDNAPAATDDKMFGFEKSELLDAVEIITVAIMVILVILLVLQPMVGRLLANEGPALGEELETELLAARASSPQLMAPDSLRGSDEFRTPQLEDDETLIDMSRVEGKVKASSVKKVEDIVENYPAETVSVLRSWMTQES